MRNKRLKELARAQMASQFSLEVSGSLKYEHTNNQTLVHITIISCTQTTINRERFAGLNFHGF